MLRSTCAVSSSVLAAPSSLGAEEDGAGLVEEPDAPESLCDPGG
jgi:hypothetical protein